jgi:hypothetical protein
MVLSVAFIVLVGALWVFLYVHGQKEGGNWFTRRVVITAPDWLLRVPTWVRFAVAVVIFAGVVALVTL